MQRAEELTASGVRRRRPTSRSEPSSAPAHCRACGEVPPTQSRGPVDRAPEPHGPTRRAHPLPARPSPQGPICFEQIPLLLPPEPEPGQAAQGSGGGFPQRPVRPWVTAGSPGGQHYNALLPAATGSPGTGKRCRWPCAFQRARARWLPAMPCAPSGGRKAALGEGRGRVSL